MKNHIFFIYLIGLFFTLSSCSEEIDLDQYDDLSVIPTYESSILYVEAPEELINLAPDADFFVQDFNFSPFSEAFFADRVQEGIITYALENTTSKPLSISLTFLGETDTILDVEVFSIGADPSANLQREVVYGATGKSLEIIKNTSKIRVMASNLGDNISVSANEESLIKLKSSGKFSVKLK